MDKDDIQAWRKQRLQEAIDLFFGGRRVDLARKMRNRHGAPLKDGSYVGHLLLPAGEKHSRPIDEDKVREIESIRPELRGWFNLGQEGVPAGAAAELSANATLLQLQRYTAKTLPDQVDRAFLYISTDPLFSWSNLGVELDVDPTDRAPRDGAIYLVRTVGGTPVVGQCRVTISGFELLVGAAQPLESDRHISEVVGRCTHIGADLP